MLKGLIFDVDGVITDSATYHLKAWRALATSLGIDLPAAADDELRGRSRMDSLAVIMRYAGRTGQYTEAELQAMADQKNAMYQQAIQSMNADSVLPGMRQLLEDARQAHLTMVIASASRNAPVILEHLNLTQYFDAVVDPATLTHGKPDPEIYQRAQELLGLAADEVISFEDAPAGVAAIKAAGQFAVGIGAATTLAAADYNVPDTAHLVLANVIHAFQQA